MADTSNAGGPVSGYPSGKGMKIMSASGGGKVKVSKSGVKKLEKMGINPFDRSNAAGKSPKVTNK